MSQMPPVRRRSDAAQERKTPSLSSKRKMRKQVVITISLVVFLSIIVLVFIAYEAGLLGSYQGKAGTVVRLTKGDIVDYASGKTDPADDTSAVDVNASYYNGLVISEIMPSNRSAVPDEAGEYPDWIEIWNNSGHDIDLENVGLSDANDAVKFLFPKMTIQADERIIVYCTGTNQAEPGKPLKAKFKLSSNGETVFLYNTPYVISSVTYGIMGTDTSWALQADGTYAETAFYSPGYENTEAGFQAYRTATRVTEGALVINEISPCPRSGLADGDGEYSDWIELYNTTDRTISLDNYALSDDEGKPLKWRFPSGATIAPHSTYVVFCSGKDTIDAVTMIPHTNFRLSAEHDSVVVSTGTGALVDRVIIDNVPEDCVYARQADGTFVIRTMGTPGMENTEANEWVMDREMRRANATGVWISEVMASNSTTVLPNTSESCDWVELYNSSSQAVDLSGYGLSDRIGRPRKWQFPEGTIIYPGEYLIVLCDANAEATTSSALHTNFKIKRAGGETICLSDPTGKVLDRLVLPEIPTDVSYGRTTALTGFFYYDTPTVRAANGNDGFRGYCADVTFTEEPGLHYQTVYVAFNVPEGTEVYYTTDGSIPTEKSIHYQGETFEINYTVVIRARAFSSSLKPSDVLTGTFFINAYHSLPIVSLVADPYELWNEETGLLVAGPNVDKSKGIPFKNTIYRTYGKTKRLGHVEYYLLDGTQLLNQDIEFALQGQFSLDMPQKTFKLHASSKNGAKTFAAALFDDRDYTEYKNIVLRNSGNDCVWTRLLDGFQSRLLDAYGSQIAHQAWNPVVVYLNGEYWGHYNMRERADKYMIAQFEGLPLDQADEITVLEASGTLCSGSNDVRREYRNMISRIKSSDPAHKEADLQYILDNVDVDNYLEYMALLMFVGDSDPGNIRFYKLPGEGSKWKWLWYDKDYGLFNSTFDSPASYTKKKGMGQQNIDNTIFLKLLEVPEYKDLFLRKLGNVYQTFTSQYMLSVLDPLVEQIKPEMTMHWTRWGEENDTAIISELPTTADGAYRYWEKRITRLQNTLKKRPYYLWGYVKDAFGLTNSQMLEYFGERPALPDDAY